MDGLMSSKKMYNKLLNEVIIIYIIIMKKMGFAKKTQWLCVQTNIINTKKVHIYWPY